MSKFRTSFEMEIDVTFHDPDKAKAYFIDGDWKESFWTLECLGEVAKKLAHHFHGEPLYFDPKEKRVARMVEGFGRFIDTKIESIFELEPEAAELSGGITIAYEMPLEATYVIQK